MAIKGTFKVKEKKTAKTGVCLGVVIFVLLQFSVFMGCASVEPMDSVAIGKYGLGDNLDLFKNYQYFVSRDIVLTSTNVETESDIRSGQAFSSTKVAHDVLQLLSSTTGKCLDYNVNPELEEFKLGIEFDEGSNNLLWFYYSYDDDYFYLDYTNRNKEEIDYAGKTYKVSYEQASGIGATFKRLTTSKKAKNGDYQNMEPLLLFEENAKQTETETRRTLGGSKL
jgi:hypothetical protein